MYQFADIETSRQETVYFQAHGLNGNFRIINVNFLDKTIQPLTYCAIGGFLGKETVENIELFLQVIEQIARDRDCAFIYDSMYDLYNEKAIIELLAKKGYKIVTADQGGQLIVKALINNKKEKEPTLIA